MSATNRERGEPNNVGELKGELEYNARSLHVKLLVVEDYMRRKLTAGSDCIGRMTECSGVLDQIKQYFRGKEELLVKAAMAIVSSPPAAPLLKAPPPMGTELSVVSRSSAALSRGQGTQPAGDRPDIGGAVGFPGEYQSTTRQERFGGARSVPYPAADTTPLGANKDAAGRVESQTPTAGYTNHNGLDGHQGSGHSRRSNVELSMEQPLQFSNQAGAAHQPDQASWGSLSDKDIASLLGVSEIQRDRAAAASPAVPQGPGGSYEPTTGTLASIHNNRVAVADAAAAAPGGALRQPNAVAPPPMGAEVSVDGRSSAAPPRGPGTQPAGAADSGDDLPSLPSDEERNRFVFGEANAIPAVAQVPGGSCNTGMDTSANSTDNSQVSMADAAAAAPSDALRQPYSVESPGVTAGVAPGRSGGPEQQQQHHHHQGGRKRTAAGGGTDTIGANKKRLYGIDHFVETSRQRRQVRVEDVDPPGGVDTVHVFLGINLNLSNDTHRGTVTPGSAHEEYLQMKQHAPEDVVKSIMTEERKVFLRMLKTNDEVTRVVNQGNVTLYRREKRRPKNGLYNYFVLESDNDDPGEEKVRESESSNDSSAGTRYEDSSAGTRYEDSSAGTSGDKDSSSGTGGGGGGGGQPMAGSASHMDKAANDPAAGGFLGFIATFSRDDETVVSDITDSTGLEVEASNANQEQEMKDDEMVIDGAEEPCAKQVQDSVAARSGCTGDDHGKGARQDKGTRPSSQEQCKRGDDTKDAEDHTATTDSGDGAGLEDEAPTTKADQKLPQGRYGNDDDAMVIESEEACRPLVVSNVGESGNVQHPCAKEVRDTLTASSSMGTLHGGNGARGDWGTTRPSSLFPPRYVAVRTNRERQEIVQISGISSSRELSAPTTTLERRSTSFADTFKSEYDLLGKANLSRPTITTSTYQGYKIWSTQETQDAMQKIVKDVSGLLSLPPEATMVLLRNYHWNDERLCDDYLFANDNDKEQILQMCGVWGRCSRDNNNGQANTSTTLSACSICTCDNLPRESLFSLGCGHEFCKTCWGGYLTVAIKGQGPRSVYTTCPQHGCQEVVTEREVHFLVEQQLLEQHLLAKFQEYQLCSYVEGNSLTRWCPGPSCGSVAVGSTSTGLSGPGKCTKCHTRWCLGCGESDHDHAPATCDMMNRWKKKVQREDESLTYSWTHTKECPGCSVRISKDGGCNHMTCANCSFQFCWLCLQDWNGHLACNRPELLGAPDFDRTNRVERFRHCYNRYQNHQQGQGFAETQLAGLPTLQANYERRQAAQQREQAEPRGNNTIDDNVWSKWEALETALKQLVECRKILKFTYVVTYYLDHQVELFQARQADLELFTERLSEVTERSVEHMGRNELVDLTGTVGKYAKSVKEHWIDDEDDPML